MKTAILFDLDGTLLDTLDDLHGAVNHVLADFGYPTRTRQEVCAFVGNGAARLMQQPIVVGCQDRYVLSVIVDAVCDNTGQSGNVSHRATLSGCRLEQQQYLVVVKREHIDFFGLYRQCDTPQVYHGHIQPVCPAKTHQLYTISPPTPLHDGCHILRNM
jgi:hypothetical protein